VPLLARMPAGFGGRSGPPPEVPELVDNLDLTATILDLADANPCTAQGECRTLDGRSLLPLLKGRRPSWSKGRALLYQIGQNRTCGELPEKGLRNYYDAVRTSRYVYIELNRVNPDTGACDRPEYELYDLKKDPYQLESIAVDPAVATPSQLQQSLAARLNELRNCAGIPGRDAPVPGHPFCD
jgi:arylsulfatase A-like enzyme